jgi:hypothetical protein
LLLKRMLLPAVLGLRHTSSLFLLIKVVLR